MLGDPILVHFGNCPDQFIELTWFNKKRASTQRSRARYIAFDQ